MNNIRVLLTRLSSNLSSIREKVRIENSTNDMSLNVLLETRLLEVYNYTVGINLENSNLFLQNSPGIDGFDKVNKIMAQVTSTFSNKKIEHTIAQVLDHRLYEKYSRLIFIFLAEKKKISDKFKKQIQRQIAGKFNFNFETDLIDLDDIYKYHFNKQDIEKIHKVVNLLDEVLEYLPKNSESGFSAISVCFHEEELENVFSLVDAIIREGRNVYVSSKKLYDKFKSVKHPLSDFIIYADPLLSYKNISCCITVLSNSFIIHNFPNVSSHSCHLFANALQMISKLKLFLLIVF